MTKLRSIFSIIILLVSITCHSAPLVHATISQAMCSAVYSGSCEGTCGADQISVDQCATFTGTYYCCVNLTTLPPPPPPGPPGGGTTPVPNTACPADTTYVAITNSCVSVDEFNNFLFNLLVVAGALVAIYRATAGFFMFITAEGNPEKLKNGREALTQAMVGLLIVVGGWVLIRVFETLLPSMWNIILTGA